MHKLPSNKKLSSKFLCEEDKFLSIKKKQTGFALPIKSLGACSIALINPPFCGDTFLPDILYLLILWIYLIAKIHLHPENICDIKNICFRKRSRHLKHIWQENVFFSKMFSFFFDLAPIFLRVNYELTF